MASAQQLRAVIEAHVAAVGAADAPMLAALYAPDGRVYDPAGAAPVVGRAAIAELFARALTGPRDTQIVSIAVTGDDAAVHFRATQSNGRSRDIIDTMTFNEQAQITAMRAYAT
jgi:steroid delta-isomerase